MILCVIRAPRHLQGVAGGQRAARALPGVLAASAALLRLA